MAVDRRWLARPQLNSSTYLTAATVQQAARKRRTSAAKRAHTTPGRLETESELEKERTVNCAEGKKKVKSRWEGMTS